MVNQYTLRTSEGKQDFKKIKLIFFISVDLNKCLKQIKMTVLYFHVTIYIYKDCCTASDVFYRGKNATITFIYSC